MENKKNSSVMVDALSPSRITDYFNSSRTKTKGHHDSAKQNKVSASSIYLTPESSPGSNFGSDAPREGDETSTTVYSTQDLCCNTDTQTADNKTVQATNESAVSNVPDSTSTTHLTNICTSPCKSNEELNLHRDSDVNSDNSVLAQCTENSQAHLQTTENANSKPLKSKYAKGRNPNTVPETNETLATSPSVPRPKLRKGAKSNSQSDGLIPANNEPAKPKPGRRKKKEPEPIQKNVITDFFPVRRSGRIPKSEIEKEKHHQLEQMILTKCEDGLKVTDFENKGRGVVTTKEFQKGDFVVEYAGELIDTATAKQREKDYAVNPEIGCYMYFFSMGPKNYCVDATAESGRLGRLINHSREGNCCTKAVIVNSKPRLILVANRNITAGEELSYDYGDRSRAAIQAHPWLKL